MRRDTGANQMPDTTPAEIVDEPRPETDFGARLLPDFPNVADRKTVAVEDEGAIDAPRLQSALHDVRKFAAHRQKARELRLAVLAATTDHPIRPVVIAPLELSHLRRAPARPKEEENGVTD